MSEPNPKDPRQMVLVIQIIAIALIMGVATFMVMALLINQGQQPKQGQLAYLGIGMAGLALVGQAFFRLGVDLGKVDRETFDPCSDEALLAFAPVYQMELIIKLALLEGAAFMNGVAYLVEIRWWSLAAMGALLAVMCLKFPTKGRITTWIERRTIDLRFARDDF